MKGHIIKTAQKV